MRWTGATSGLMVVLVSAASVDVRVLTFAAMMTTTAPPPLMILVLTTHHRNVPNKSRPI